LSFRPKYPKHLEFNVDVKWNGTHGGIVKTKEGHCVEFAIPDTFGGQGNAFCPDELFAASVAGCLMNTFLHTRERLGLDMEAFSLQVQVDVEFEHGRYQITKVIVEGTLVIDENDMELGEECLRIAKDYCHISRSLVSCIPIEYLISIESPVKYAESRE